MKKNKIYMIIGGLLIASGITAAIVNTVRGNALAAEIRKRLKSGTNQYGDYRDVAIKPGFNSTYWKQGANSLIEWANVRAMATKLHNAIGLIYNDYPVIVNIFSSLRNQTELSQLAYIYETDKKTNLFEEISKFKTDKANEVSQILSNLK